MCDLAFEIQNLWKPAIGDYYFSIEHRKIYLLTRKEIKDKKFNRWLPTEKQLFRLYQKCGVFDWRKFDEDCSKFWDYLVKVTGENPTKEMCSLSIIMFSRFFKKWNNKKWHHNYQIPG